ncbi:SIS domain-containing protein [Lacrimispora saccharolytica]|uniref:Sugar isomerase (SIS) n=1 Tax=Lacrimispora saccharolytica (strain ATCC 35040 / DSM 2544 / NRCC 2533 / WM1) TaxID=610130 RepID=D9R2Q7_LACSW|nr:SIS domain-containing protein [Lacrimispora saccharolytica]ADL06681.1 sugar isomerase (SIS) [[Clostridium] saccharolyticum WM1]QRV19250.1 SIS domain-containing protein [Lacrimispora saccharolytica]
MIKVEEIIREILEAKREIYNISFVGCGGSLVGFYPAYYYVTKEAKKIAAYYISSNEFVHDMPKSVGVNSIVVVATRRGNTPETVEAARLAKEAGASVIGLAFVEESELNTAVDYLIKFYDVDPDPFETGKGELGLRIAVELLHQSEQCTNYDQMIGGFTAVNGLIAEAKKRAVPQAIKFSLDCKNDTVIYTMGSGTAWGSAHQESICIFMEMQWINSSVIHTGEFFHGPFEITDPDTAFLLFKSTGKTRELDDRVIKFLDQYNNHTIILDAKEYGVDQLGEVSEYFDALFYNAIIGVYNDLLADIRNHPLDKRKYMWKYNY